MNTIKQIASTQSRKAFVATLIAAIGSATIAADGGFTTTEWLTIAGVALVAFQATYWTSNAQAVENPVDTPQQRNFPPITTTSGDAGYGLVETAFTRPAVGPAPTQTRPAGVGRTIREAEGR